MIEKILEQKLGQYAPKNAVDQENALSELMQHFVLTGLSRAKFFDVAQFHGGTFLRMFHGLDRFSEDLDFVLKEGVSRFSWTKYLSRVLKYLSEEGLPFEVTDKTKDGEAVQKAFFKTDAVGNSLVVDLPHSRHPRRKVRIKLEVDTAPPAGSTFTTNYLSFPVLTAITTQTLESAFASKSHALLCRSYVKGRDWYDFLWYVAEGVRPNFELLQNAVRQQGPWAGQEIVVDAEWCVEQLRAKVASVDWRLAAQDVRRFVPSDRQTSLDLWSEELFLVRVDQLSRILGS